LFFGSAVADRAEHRLSATFRALYEQIFWATVPSGRVLICDHTPLDDSLKSMSLYMREEERRGRSVPAWTSECASWPDYSIVSSSEAKKLATCSGCC